MIHAEEHRAISSVVVAHSKELADQRADDRCSFVRCGQCEPSIIWKERSVRQLNFKELRK
jgi:hypothetical protein